MFATTPPTINVENIFGTDNRNTCSTQINKNDSHAGTRTEEKNGLQINGFAL